MKTPTGLTPMQKLRAAVRHLEQYGHTIVTPGDGRLRCKSCGREWQVWNVAARPNAYVGKCLGPTSW